MLKIQKFQEFLFNVLYGKKRWFGASGPSRRDNALSTSCTAFDESDKNVNRNKIVNYCAKLNASDVDKYSDYQSLHSQFHDVDFISKKENVAELKLEAEIQQISALVLKDFVLSWYQQISFGNNGAENAQKIIDQITKTAYVRISAIDRHALINKCMELYMCHLREFQDAMKTYNQQPLYRRRGSVPTAENEFKKVKSIEEVYDKNLQFHVALIGGDNEAEYLRAIVDLLLQRLLTAELYNCATVKDMFTEVLICNVVLPLLELLCDPDFLHEKTIQILTDAGDDIYGELMSMKEKLIVYKDECDGASSCSASDSRTAVDDGRIRNTPTKEKGTEDDGFVVKGKAKTQIPANRGSTESPLKKGQNHEMSSKTQSDNEADEKSPKKSTNSVKSELDSKPKEDLEPRRASIPSVSVHGHGNADSLMQPSGCEDNQEFAFFTEALAQHFNIAPVKKVDGESRDGLNTDVPQNKTSSESGPLFSTLPIIQLQPSKGVDSQAKVQGSGVKSLTKFSSLPRDLDKMAQRLDTHSANKKKQSRRLSLNSLPSDDNDTVGSIRSKPLSASLEKGSSVPSNGSGSSSYEQIDMFEVFQDPVTGHLRVRQRSCLAASPPNMPKVLPPVTEDAPADYSNLDLKNDYSTRVFRNSSNVSEFLVISSSIGTNETSPFNSMCGTDSLDAKGTSTFVSSLEDRSATTTGDRSVGTFASVELEHSLTSVSTIDTVITPTGIRTMQLVENSSDILSNVPNLTPVIDATLVDGNISPKRKSSWGSSPNMVQNFSFSDLPSQSSSPSDSEKSFSPTRLPTSLSSSPGNSVVCHVCPSPSSSPGKMEPLLSEINSSRNLLPSLSSDPGSCREAVNAGSGMMWPSWDQRSRESTPEPMFPSTEETRSESGTWVTSVYVSLHIPRTEFIQERGHGSFVVYEIEVSCGAKLSLNMCL
jgi:hypothetical protein